jgi:hypothetical protein
MAEIKVRMKLKGHGLATQDELTLRHKFQEEIEARQIGKDLGGGSGFGEMDVLLEVADSKIAKHRLRLLAQELGIAEVTTITDCL